MATKAEYLAALASRSEWVGDPTEDTNVGDNTSGAMRLYNVPILAALPNGTFSGQTQGFYVRDEGEASEAVYPVNQERKSNPPSAFETQARAYVATRITAARPKIVIDKIDADNEFVLVTAYEINADDKVETKHYFIAKDGSTPYIKEFVG